MTRELRRHTHCLNCETPLGGNFCAECGQENSDYRVSLTRLLGDVAEELLQLESRLWRSAWTLVRRPGRLTADYNGGRRVRWTSPLRLYLLASVAYFFVAALAPKVESFRVDFGNEATLPGPLEPASSAFERRLRDRLGIESRTDLQTVDTRARALLAVNAPKVMALLVPLFALLTWLLFRTPRRFYVEHLVLALHAHAVAFLGLMVTALVRFPPVVIGLSLAEIAWLALALRLLFAQSWWRIALKLVVLLMIYLVLVSLGIIAALLI